MKFTPTPERNESELRDDLQEFGKKLRLLKHFHGRQQISDSSLVKNKSNFVPPQVSDRLLTLFLESLTNISKTGSKPKNKSNISSSEKLALKNLSEDKSIVIKEADKGGATVIMDRTYYQNKIFQLLPDTETYIELTGGNEDGKIMRKLKRLTKEHERELNPKLITYKILHAKHWTFMGYQKSISHRKWKT